MFCLNCGKQLPEEAKFCIQCGKPISKADDNADHEKNDGRGRKGFIILIGALGVAACVLIAIVVIATIQKDRAQRRAAFTGTQGLYSTSLYSPTPRPTPFWKTEISEIKAKAIALGPGQIWWQPLRVENDWRSARLVGRFSAQGGSGNDVYAMVTDDDGLTNFRNNHGCKVWYESGRVTVDTINARLPAGQSYFVLSNKFSIFAHKSVTFDLRVEYERLVQP
jgi:hypothetical protein